MMDEGNKCLPPICYNFAPTQGGGGKKSVRLARGLIYFAPPFVKKKLYSVPGKEVGSG